VAVTATATTVDPIRSISSFRCPNWDSSFVQAGPKSNT